ncbi:hypothetical protein JCM10450v2_004517 [Rhodotorula kratochvilovae]
MADLVPHIYHETQEPGSMLCGQHALNNLLQSSLSTAPDLADIARQLDALERAQLDPGVRLRGDGFDGGGGESANYDDSGFFSVQVMEEALKVLGLRLIRWGSKEMTAVHDQPERIEGFLLNHQLHWFSIRRFGPSPERFYNLDSCIPQPQWISAMYLGLTLREAERQGYSIFAVVPAPESAITGLPQCSAEDRARTLPPPRGTSSNGFSNGGGGEASGSGTHTRFGGGGEGHTLAGSSSSGAGAFASNGHAATSSSAAARKGKRPASPLDEILDDDDDDVIIEEPSSAAGRRQRRRVGEAPPAAAREGMSDEEMMAAAIAESLRVSSGSDGGSGGPGGAGTQNGAEGSRGGGQAAHSRAAQSEEDEYQRAVQASLAEAGGAAGASDEEGGEEDSPSMEELRRRRMARFG